MNAIVISGLNISRGSREVLKNIDLQIPSGAFIGVLGPNGAGKTTLFKAILGLIKPSSGQISIFDKTASGGNPNIGYLPQARSLPDHIHLEVGEFLNSSWDGERWGFAYRTHQAWSAILNALSPTHLAIRTPWPARG